MIVLVASFDAHTGTSLQRTVVSVLTSHQHWNRFNIIMYLLPALHQSLQGRGNRPKSTCSNLKAVLDPLVVHRNVQCGLTLHTFAIIRLELDTPDLAPAPLYALDQKHQTVSVNSSLELIDRQLADSSVGVGLRPEPELSPTPTLVCHHKQDQHPRRLYFGPLPGQLSFPSATTLIHNYCKMEYVQYVE